MKLWNKFINSKLAWWVANHMPAWGPRALSITAIVLSLLALAVDLYMLF